jgi:HlyD family secretion protein
VVPRWLASRKPAAIAVTVHSVTRGNVRDLVSSLNAGRVAARREVTLRAEIGGTVATLNHRRGDTVKAGEPLLTFDDRELSRRLRVAQAQLMVARAQAAQADKSANVAKRDAVRADALSSQGALAGADAEKVVGNAEVMGASASVAGAGVAQASANVALAQYALDKTVVRAPFDGVVLTHASEQGDVLVPGAPLFTFADEGELHVDVDFDESDIARIRPGMRAELSFDALPGERIPGVVRAIAPSSTRDAKGSRSVVLEVTLAADPRLRVGLGADVDVIVDERPNVIWAPPNGVSGRGLERTVYVVEGGVAKKRSIEVGVATWEAVEVTKGLSPGDTVITSLTTKGLEDGVRVTTQVETEKPSKSLVR